MHFLKPIIWIALVIGHLAYGPTSWAGTPLVAAASDLKFALEEIAASYRTETRNDVKLTFGSSGTLYQQIRQGAPFEIFFSADEGFVDQLVASKFALNSGELYAIGRVVLFAPRGSNLKIDAEGVGLREAMARGLIERFAIANPEHAPYGRAAEQALRKMGLWDAIKPKLVLGENVSQAAQFATSGSAQGGILAYSLVLSPALKNLGTHVLIPSEWHSPLRQKMVLLRSAGPEAKTFYRYVGNTSSRAILRRYGFILPGEQ